MNRVICTVRIQIEPIATIGILLSKPSDDWIVEAGAEIVLLGDGVKLLAGELEAVGDGLILSRNVPPRVILIAVLDLSLIVNDMGRRPHLVAGVVVVRPYRIRASGDQLRGPDETGQSGAVLLGDNLPILIEDELDQVPVLRHLMEHGLFLGGCVPDIARGQLIARSLLLTNITTITYLLCCSFNQCVYFFTKPLRIIIFNIN